MGGISKAKVKKKFHQKQIKKKGPSKSTKCRMEKPIMKLHGVAALMVETPDFDESLLPHSSLQELKQHRKDKHKLS